jgi:hypothetical protein
MARQTFSAGDTGAQVRSVIDNNFTELYDDYMPLNGGTFTGPLGVTVATQNKATPSITSGTLSLNLSASSFFVVTVNSTVNNFNLQNVPASPRVYSFALQLTYTSSTLYTVNWTGAPFKWAGGIAPTLTCVNGKYDLFNFLTHDGGLTWFAFIAELNQ